MEVQAQGAPGSRRPAFPELLGCQLCARVEIPARLPCALTCTRPERVAQLRAIDADLQGWESVQTDEQYEWQQQDAGLGSGRAQQQSQQWQSLGIPGV